MNNAIKWIVSVIIASFFLWLTMKDQNWAEIYNGLQTMPLQWIFPFTITTLIAHFLRAERWRLLVENDGEKSTRWTLFTGVMLGYLVNYTIPRLGEVSRCVYVAKKENMKTSKIVGMVVMERVIDSVVLLLICFSVFIFVISDPEILISLFGYDPTGWKTVLAILSLLAIGLIGLYVLFRLRKEGKLNTASKGFLSKILSLVVSLIDGILSIRQVKNWPYFLFLTIGIWLMYVMMTWFPMAAVTSGIIPELGLMEALTVMAISSIGIVLPSPGGVGTYHFFVEKALTVLFFASSTHALTYAFASHTVMFIVILVSTPIILFINFFLTRTKSPS